MYNIIVCAILGITWSSNSALYGVKYSTQAVTIVSDAYTVQQFDDTLSPPYSAHMFDYYGNQLQNENYTVAEIEPCTDCPYNCDGKQRKN